MARRHHGCVELDDDADLCPPNECVVRTDLVGDAVSPPAYCELCPLHECEWEPGAVCLGLRKLRSRQGNAAKAYWREYRRVQRETAINEVNYA